VFGAWDAYCGASRRAIFFDPAAGQISTFFVSFVIFVSFVFTEAAACA
jgi:hypothetical protein